MTSRATPSATEFRTLRYEDGALHVLDQTELPFIERELTLTSAAEVAAAIKRLAIRGAPLIGVAAAYGLALELRADRRALDRRVGDAELALRAEHPFGRDTADDGRPSIVGDCRASS